MLLNDGRWSEADTDEIVRELLHDLERPADKKALQDFAARNRIVQADTHPLSFYGDGQSYRLVRLSLTPDAIRAGDRYARAYLCYIKGPQLARYLDGSSTVMHQTNSLKLAGSGKRLIQLTTDEKVVDYLKFFCTFTTGEAGPFLILDSVDDLAFGVEGELRQGSTFEQMCAVRARDTGWPEPLLELTEADLKAWREAPQEKEREFRERAAREHQQSMEPVDLTRVSLEQPRVTEKSFDPETKQRNGDIAVASLWYGPAIFNARFRVYSNGSIEMLEDRPIAPLNISSWRFLSPSGILVREDHVSRSDLSAADFVEQFIAGRQPEQALHIANLSIGGDVDLSGLEFGGPVTFENVMIDGELALNGCRFAKGLRLDRVEVTGRLMASKLNARFVTSRRLRVGGLFEIRGSVADDSDGNPPFGADFSRALIEDEFVLPGTEVNGGFNLSGIKVKGVADLSNLKVEPRFSTSRKAREELGTVSLSNKVAGLNNYDAGLHARGSEFDEDLRLSYAELGPSRSSARIKGGVDLYSASIGRELDFAGLQTDLVTYATEAVANGRADAGSLVPVYDVTRQSVASRVPELRSGLFSLNAARIGKDANGFGGALKTIIRGDLDGSFCHVGGRVGLDLARIGCDAQELRPFEAQHALTSGDVDFSWATIGVILGLSSAEICGTLNCTGIKVGQMLDGDSRQGLVRTVIKGNVSLSGAEIGSDTRFCGASISGELMAITGRFGRLQFRPIAAEEDGKSEILPMQIGAFVLQQVKAHSLDLFACEIEKELIVQGCEIESGISLSKTGQDTYLFRDLSSESAEKARRETVENHTLCARVKGNAKLVDTKVGGEVDISGLQCSSDISLRALNVEGTLTAAAINGVQDGEPRVFAVACKQFHGDELDVTGHANLGGIDAKGGLQARFGSFGAELTILDMAPSGRPKKNDRPSVDLFGTKGDRLKIGCGATGVGRIDLQGAEFTQITVCDPDKVSLNPKGLQVGRWAFTDKDGHSLSNEGQRLFQLLKRSEFDQGVYGEAERWLRRRGNENAADRLHISGRAQAARRRRSNYAVWSKPFRVPVDALVDFFHRNMTGYWTRSWPLMAIWTVLFVPSVLLASNPANIAPSAIQLGEQETRAVRDIRPEAEDWSPLDVIRVVASNHVPIIPLVAEPRWEYHDQAPVEVKLPDMAERYLPLGASQVEIRAPGFLTPAFYGFWVRVFSWIALPVFLISTAASIQRRYNL